MGMLGGAVAAVTLIEAFSRSCLKPRRDEDVPSASQVLPMATSGGAATTPFGSHIGTVAVGKVADLVLINWDKLTDPYLHPETSVVDAVQDAGFHQERPGVEAAGREHAHRPFDERRAAAALSMVLRRQGTLMSSPPGQDSPPEWAGFELLVPSKEMLASATIRLASAPLVGAKKQHSCREGPVVRIRLPPGEGLLRNWSERWSRGGRARRHSLWISASPASSPSRSAKALR